MLAAPDFAFIFRYRVPNLSWGGNPAYSPCYQWPFENQPIQNLTTRPEIFGANFESLDDFMNAYNIGDVSRDNWPSFNQ